MKKTIMTVLLLLLAGLLSAARNTMFEDALNAVTATDKSFTPGAAWVPYPVYSDREAWAKFAGKRKNYILKKASAYDTYEWTPVTASTYLKYEKSGNRALMSGCEKNRMCLNTMILAELVEGQGRYLQKIADFVWLEANRYSWAHAQHTSRQATGRTLPDPEDRFISLHVAENAISIAYAYHFFKDEFDKMDPSISLAVYNAMKENVFDPFFDESKNDTSEHAFLGLGKKNTLLNNWNPYCNYGILTAFLLMCDNQEDIYRAVSRSAASLDAYLSYITDDGCCDEGPDYWSMSFGRVYECSRLLYDASYGKVNVMNNPLLKRMVEYMPAMNLGNGWVVNFSDAVARRSDDAGLIFRFGRDVGSDISCDYAVSQLVNVKDEKFNYPGMKFAQLASCLENLRAQKQLALYEKVVLERYSGNYEALHSKLSVSNASAWYPETGQAVLRKGQWTLAAKGGHNNESHNHNDVGSCILMYDSMPVFVDPGSADYVKDTFGASRYSLWYNTSSWHSTPSINGTEQANGREYGASECECKPGKGMFRVEFSKAYPRSACAERYDRTYTLSSKGLVITDKYEISSRMSPDILNFVLLGKPEVKGNIVSVRVRDYEGEKENVVNIKYPSSLSPVITERPIDPKDKKMQRSWKDSLWHLEFVSTQDAPVSGTYTFVISK